MDSWANENAGWVFFVTCDSNEQCRAGLCCGFLETKKTC